MSGDSRTALWTVPVSNLAGVARHVLDVASTGLPGVSLEFLAPPGPLVDELELLGARVHVEDFGPEFGVVASARSLRRAIEVARPHVVHSHLSYADIVSAIAARRGVPLISTEHGIAPDDRLYHESRLSAAVMANVHRARLRRFARVIAVSEATATAIIDKWHPPARLVPVVIRNGARTSFASRASGAGGGPRVASIARLAPEKGIDRTIAAFAEVLARRADAQLVIAGDGDLRAELLERCRSLRILDAVLFVGHVDASELLTETDVLVQLSTWENCSYSLIDAVVAGCGVVAADVGGNPELLPTQCLIDRDANPSEIADRVFAQLDQSARPSLPPEWPDLEVMCRSIAAVYEGVVS